MAKIMIIETPKMKTGGWISGVKKSIKRRGTEGKCTPMTKPGCTGRALALAKTFHKIAAKRKKHEDGGMVDMYAEGGQLPQDLLEARMRASGASQDEIDAYTAEHYAKGGWISDVRKSIKRRGTEGVCTGSKFGGPTCRPGTKRYALAKTFRKMAKARKHEEGGTVDMYEDYMTGEYGEPEEMQYAQGGEVDMYGRGGYTVKRSSARKGKTHVVIGPDGTKKYFGDSKLGQHPENPARKKAFYARHAKNLKNNPYFRAFARATWADGGMVDTYADGGKLPEGILRSRLEAHMSPAEAQDYIDNYAQGGVVDVYQLMGMPTSSMYGMGGIASIVPNSRVISRQNFPNMGMGYGGQVPMYKLGSVLKDIGAGAYGAGEGLLDTLTMGATDQLTDAGYKGLQKLGGSSESEIRQQDSIRGYGTAAGAVTGAVINPGSTMSAVQQGAKGIGQGVSAGSPDSKLAQGVGTFLPMAGNMVGMAGGMGAFGTPSAGAMTKSAEFGKSGFGQFAQGAGKVGKGYNQFGSIMGGDPMAMLSMIGGGYAMGGAVNGPNLLQVGTDNMPKFAMGGMTNQPTIINVEKGELLVDPKTGKILTEYKGGGMVPHPEYGTDERGTVPAQEGMFVITKAMAKKYKSAMKNNDRLYADTIRNNIAFNKAKKEAKEEQAATTAYNKFAKKYGGIIHRMYAKGGMVPMYQDGGASIPRSTGYFDFNTYSGGPLFNQSYGASGMSNPVTGMANYISNLAPTQATPMTPIMSKMPTYPVTSEPQYQPYTGPTSRDYTTTAPMRGQGTSPAWFSRMTGAGTKEPDTTEGAKQGWQDKALMAAQFLPAAYNLGRGIFEKPWKPGDYETPADLKWQDLTGEAGRREMLGAYRTAQRGARELGGSNVLAGLQAGSSAYQRNIADYEEALENRNRMGRMQVDRLNKDIQQANMQMRMNRDYLAQQARENKIAGIGKGLENIAGGAGQLWQNRQMMKGLNMAYPDRTNTNVPGLSDMNVTGYTSGGDRMMGTPGLGGFQLDYSRPKLNPFKG